MSSEKKKIDETLKELMMGIAVFEAVCFVIGCFFVKSVYYYGTGLLIGAGLALFSAWHMYKSISDNLTINAGNEGGAEAYARKQSLIRYCVILAVFFLVCVTECGYPLATFLGIMGLKIGAYLQPFIHKLWIRR